MPKTTWISKTLEPLMLEDQLEMVTPTKHQPLHLKVVVSISVLQLTLLHQLHQPHQLHLPPQLCQAFCWWTWELPSITMWLKTPLTRSPIPITRPTSRTSSTTGNLSKMVTEFLETSTTSKTTPTPVMRPSDSWSLKLTSTVMNLTRKVDTLMDHFSSLVTSTTTTKVSLLSPTPETTSSVPTTSETVELFTSVDSSFEISI